MKELLLKKLTRYGYRYAEKGNLMSVKLGISLSVDIRLDTPDQCLMSDRLKPWNFLSGILEMSIRQALVFNTIALTILAALFILLDTSLDSNGLILAFLLGETWVVLWSVYYMVRAESFKSRVVGWIENNDPV